jgi:hypothetical protein
MQQWFRAGYFPGFTRVKRASDPEWRPLGSVGSIVAGGATPLLIFFFAGGTFLCVCFLCVSPSALVAPADSLRLWLRHCDVLRGSRGMDHSQN